MTEPDESNASLRDPGLSRLYRAGAEQEPPPALDAAILSAARAAVATKAGPQQPWWKRLTVPAAVAATALLAVMLSPTMERNAPEIAGNAEIAARTPPRAAPTTSGPSAAVTSGSAPLAAKKESVARSVQAREVAPTSAPVVSPAALPVAPAESKAKAIASPAATRDMADSRPPVVMEGRVAAPAARAEGLNATDSAAPMQESVAKRAAPRPEIVWLEEIRELRRQGRLEEAARRLAAFRTAYPDYPLPDDMKQEAVR